MESVIQQWKQQNINLMY
jgi:hypothetical protein